MNEQTHIWIVKRKVCGIGYLPYRICLTRDEARWLAKYFNGFSHGTKDATCRVKKYVEVK
jgi:hypothetical protein